MFIRYIVYHICMYIVCIADNIYIAYIHMYVYILCPNIMLNKLYLLKICLDTQFILRALLSFIFKYHELNIMCSDDHCRVIRAKLFFFFFSRPLQLGRFFRNVQKLFWPQIKVTIQQVHASRSHIKKVAEVFFIRNMILRI